jgi:hypothetical protein
MSAVKAFILSCLFLAGAVQSWAQPRPYGVTATVEKGVDFAKIRTYAWTAGRPSSDKTIDAQIVTAVDRELKALGMTKSPAGASDVVVAYSSLTRTDVDPKTLTDATGFRPGYTVGILVIALADPGSHRPLLQLRIDKPIETPPEQLQAAIDGAVAEMFAKYPTRIHK